MNVVEGKEMNEERLFCEMKNTRIKKDDSHAWSIVDKDCSLLQWPFCDIMLCSRCNVYNYILI